MAVHKGMQALQCHFPEEVKAQAQLYMLSSSLDESGVLKSQQYPDVRDFLRKPLRKMNFDALKFRIEAEKDKDVVLKIST